MACAISFSMTSSSCFEPSRAIIDKALQRFLLAHHANAARHALSAGFMAEECGDAQQYAL